MILSYEEAIKEYGSDYKLKKAIDSGVVFKIENGIYSSRKYNNELEVILKKYPKAILAGEYAFYIHGLTDVIPEKYASGSFTTWSTGNRKEWSCYKSI